MISSWSLLSISFASWAISTLTSLAMDDFGAGITKRCCRLSSTHSFQCRKNSLVSTLALTGFLALSSMRFLLSALLSVYGFSEYSGHTADTKAIHFPSGDQMPLPASVAMVVSCWASPPSISISQSWVSPERSDSKRIRFPSGLQRGCLSCLVLFVNCRGVPPSDETSQMLVVVLLPARSTLVSV